MEKKTYPDRGTELVAVTGLFLGLSMIFTGLRFYARAIIVKQIGSDDWLAFAAQVRTSCDATMSSFAIPCRVFAANPTISSAT